MSLTDLLDFEKRTGVANNDIDDFLRKVDAVQKAIHDMKEGAVDPSDVHVEGVPTLEEIAREEVSLFYKFQSSSSYSKKRRGKQRKGG